MPPGPRPPLRGLLGAQFLGTLNDNILRMVVILLLLEHEPTERAQQAVSTKAFLAFNAPWIVLSLPAGWLADRVSKRTAILGWKTLEIVVLALCVWALHDGRPWAVLGVLAMLGALGSLVSPAKYGILPELVPTSRLPRGNGQFVLWTYLAIILGTAAGGILLDLFRDSRWAIGIVLGASAVVGLAWARTIPAVPAAGRRGGLWDTARTGWGAIRGDRRLRGGFGGNLFYWSMAALLSQNVIVYARSTLGVSDTEKALLLTAAAVGIGAGGAAAGLASRGRIRSGYVALGAAGMAIGAALLFALRPGYEGSVAILFAIGGAAGFVVVPVNALVQDASPATLRGAVLAVMNAIIFTGIIVGSTTAWFLAECSLASPEIFGAASFLLAAGAWAALGWSRRMGRAP